MNDLTKTNSQEQKETCEILTELKAQNSGAQFSNLVLALLQIPEVYEQMQPKQITLLWNINRLLNTEPKE